MFLFVDISSRSTMDKSWGENLPVCNVPNSKIYNMYGYL